jgi:phosphatidylglycerophosphatase C
MGGPRIAVFDLDNTITRGDSLARFLRYALERRPGRWTRLPLLPFALVRYGLTRNRAAFKGALLRATVGGLSRAEAGALVDGFVAGFPDSALRPDALATMAQHRQRGDRVILLSASPDLYVEPLGRRLGISQVLASRVQWQADRLDGHFAGPNMRGVEKLRAIEALRAAHPGCFIAAYGDALADLEHLRAVDAPTLVNGRPAARRAAAALGIPTVDWP